MTEQERIPVIDIFAGPGGLGEGFSAFVDSGRSPFRIALSVEKDPYAHQTLRLPSFFRRFPNGETPDQYYRVLRREVSLHDLPVEAAKTPELLATWQKAEHEVMCADFGPQNHQTYSPRLKDSPRVLVPRHHNATKADYDSLHVQHHQCWATTIASHISEGGDYFIPSDRTQYRSLTVRQAGRLQRFPDKYLFAVPEHNSTCMLGTPFRHIHSETLHSGGLSIKWNGPTIQTASPIS